MADIIDSKEFMSRLVHSAIACIRCVECFNACFQKDLEFLKFSRNCFGELAAIHWCTLFGAWSEETHFKKFFALDDVKALRDGLDPAYAKKVILESSKISDKEYNNLRKEITEFRNNYAAHRGNVSNVHFPDINKCEIMCICLIALIKDILINAPEESKRNYNEWLGYFAHQGDPESVQQHIRRAIEKTEFLI